MCLVLAAARALRPRLLRQLRVARALLGRWERALAGTYLLYGHHVRCREAPMRVNITGCCSCCPWKSVCPVSSSPPPRGCCRGSSRRSSSASSSRHIGPRDDDDVVGGSCWTRSFAASRFCKHPQQQAVRVPRRHHLARGALHTLPVRGTHHTTLLAHTPPAKPTSL